MNTPSLGISQHNIVPQSSHRKLSQVLHFGEIAGDDFDAESSNEAEEAEPGDSLTDKARGLLKDNLSDVQANMEGTQTQLRSGLSQAKTVLLDGYKWNKLFSEASPDTDFPQRIVSIATLAFTQFLDGFKGSRTEAIDGQHSAFPSTKMMFHLYTELLSQYPQLLLETEQMPLDLIQQAINTHPFDSKSNVQKRFDGFQEKVAVAESLDGLDMKAEMRSVFFPKNS